MKYILAIAIILTALSVQGITYGGSSNITFQWNGPEALYGVTETRIYQSSTSGIYSSPPVSSIAQPTNQGTIPNIPDGTHYFVIRFANSVGESTNSIEIKAECRTVVSPRPEGFGIKEVITNP
jgi:hypothetical protein